MHHLGERTRQALRASWEEALVLAGKYALWARLAGEAGLAPVQEEFRACARQTASFSKKWPCHFFDPLSAAHRAALLLFIPLSSATLPYPAFSASGGPPD